MLKEQIKTELLAGSFLFKYKKTDGSIREANGTLNHGILCRELNEGVDLPYEVYDRYRVNPDETIVYYDLDANAWRSFRVDRYIGPVGKVLDGNNL